MALSELHNPGYLVDDTLVVRVDIILSKSYEGEVENLKRMLRQERDEKRKVCNGLNEYIPNNLCVDD
jgi:hypothetical protein